MFFFFLHLKLHTAVFSGAYGFVAALVVLETSWFFMLEPRQKWDGGFDLKQNGPTKIPRLWKLFGGSYEPFGGSYEPFGGSYEPFGGSSILAPKHP